MMINLPRDFPQERYYDLLEVALDGGLHGAKVSNLLIDYATEHPEYWWNIIQIVEQSAANLSLGPDARPVYVQHQLKFTPIRYILPEPDESETRWMEDKRQWAWAKIQMVPDEGLWIVFPLGSKPVEIQAPIVNI